MSMTDQDLTATLRRQLHDLAEQAPASGPPVAIARERGERIRRRRHLATLGAAVAACAAIVTVAAVVVPAAVSPSSPALTSAISNNTGPQPPTPGQLDRAVIASLFPVSGQDFVFDSNYGLRAFEDAVQQSETTACMRAKHAPYTPPVRHGLNLEFQHVNEFPDLALIARYGLSGRPEKDQQASAALTACQRQSGAGLLAAIRPLRTSPLIGTWNTIADQVNNDPQVETALESFGPCAQAHGVPANTEDEFFGYADSLGMNASSAAAFEREDIHLGKIYATCMQPVETIRHALRVEARRTFLRDHASAIETLQTDATTAVQKLQAQTSVSWPSRSS